MIQGLATYATAHRSLPARFDLTGRRWMKIGGGLMSMKD